MCMYGVVLTSEQQLDKKRRWVGSVEHTVAARNVRSEGRRGKEWMACHDEGPGLLCLCQGGGAGSGRYWLRMVEGVSKLILVGPCWSQSGWRA